MRVIGCDLNDAWPKLIDEKSFNLFLRAGHTAICGCITAESRPNISTREANAVERVEAVIQTRYSRDTPVVTRGEKFTRVWTRKKVLGFPKL